MNDNTAIKHLNGKSDINNSILKRMIQVGVQILVIAAALFISSGRLDWLMAWVYIGIYIAGVCINAIFLLKNNPELVAERAKIRAGTKDWDKVLGSLYIIVASIVTQFIAGLDMRFGWSQQIPLALQLVALVFGLLGFGLASWAMVSNTFFAATVRIQKDRGHTVVSDGPYKFVRHPGYVGWMMFFCIATPLILSSLWAFIPAGLAMLVFILRTALEDRTLHEELDGYKDYAQRVRYRLLPGVW